MGLTAGDNEKVEEAVETERLAGIPGIGPARRALLFAAGILTPEDFARASVEQIISVTGMPRSAALRAWEAAQKKATPAPPVAPIGVVEEVLESPTAADLPEAEDDAPVVLDTLPAPEEESVAPTAAMERSALATRIALSDVTRLATDLPRLDRALTRFVTLLDGLVSHLPELKSGNQRRIARRLEKLTARLEKASGAADGAVTTKKLGPRRSERLRERLRTERREILALMQVSQQRSKRKRRKARSK